MDNNKKISRIIIIVLLLIFIVIASVIAINIISMRQSYKKMSEGSFVIKDGVETYMEYGQVVIDKLVEVDDKIYYVDDKGHKVKDTWAIIDNDGHYGYFGNFGDLIINKIRTIAGKDYYFDENGILYQDRTGKKIKVIDGIEYVANENGELKLATEGTYAIEKDVIKETKNDNKTKTTTAQPTIKASMVNNQVSTQQTTQIASQEPLVNQTTKETSAEQAVNQSTSQISIQQPTAEVFANAIDISGNTSPNEDGGPGVSSTTTKSGVKISAVSAPGKEGKTTTTVTGHSNEVKLQKTEKIEDVVEGDEYECKITLLKPILLGTTEEETEEMNFCIEELMDAWMEDMIGTVGEYDDLPKSVIFTSANLSSVTKTKVVVTLTGSLKNKSGSNKTLKYKITYDRENINADFSKTSND